MNWYSTAEGIKGGCEIINDDLKRVLERQGHDVEIVTCQRAANALQRAYDSNYYRYAIIDRAYLLSDYIEQREKLFGIDLIISQDCCLAFSNLKTKLISWTNNPYLESGKISATMFGGMIGHYFYNEFSRLYPHTQYLQIEKSALNIVPSQYMRQYCEELNMRVDEVIPHPVDTTLFKPMSKEEARAKLGIPPDARVGIWNGAFHPIKGYHTLVELIKRRQDVTWLLIFKHPVRQRPKLKNVRIFTQIPREKLPTLYSAADFDISCSYVESFNLTAIEAMACGIPCILSKAGWAWNETKEINDWGILIDKWDDIGAYKDAIDKITELDFHPRKALVEKGFTLEQWGKKWDRILKEVANEG